MKQFIRKPSAWIPIAMSLTALVFTLVWWAIFGIVRQQDEGIAAHIFQLLMVIQLPIILLFVVKWLPQKPKQAFMVLILQIFAIIIAFATVYILEL